MWFCSVCIILVCLAFSESNYQECILVASNVPSPYLLSVAASHHSPQSDLEFQWGGDALAGMGSGIALGTVAK